MLYAIFTPIRRVHKPPRAPSPVLAAHPHPMPSSTTSADSPTAPDSGSGSDKQPPKPKKHVCPTCDRAFTTSGHLARHARVHTGERNHACPFPGCNTRCSRSVPLPPLSVVTDGESRQDNLQQHYRVHLSPRSRNISTSAARAAMARAVQPYAAPEPRPSTPAPLAAPQMPVYRSAALTTTTATWWPDPSPSPTASFVSSASSSYPYSAPYFRTPEHYSPPAPIRLGAQTPSYLSQAPPPLTYGYAPQQRATWKADAY